MQLFELFDKFKGRASPEEISFELSHLEGLRLVQWRHTDNEVMLTALGNAWYDTREHA